MRSIVGKILFTFVVQVCAEELTPYQDEGEVQNTMEKIVNDIIGDSVKELFDRKLKASVVHYTDLDNMTFGKLAHIMVLDRTKLRTIPRGRFALPWDKDSVTSRLHAARGQGFGGNSASGKSKESPTTLDDDARRRLALQAMQFSLDVMLKLQDPAVKLFDNLGFEKLLEIKHLVKVQPSNIEGAGLGLKVRGNVSKGSVVAFMPVHGIGMDNLESLGESTFVVADDADSAYFDSVANNPPYRQCLPSLHKRGLFFLDNASVPDGVSAFIDVNPKRVDSLGWVGSRVNDGATCAAPDEKAVIAYYEASKARRNCILVPFGPTPLMAYVTTRAVHDGEELLTTYGCEYWLAGKPDASAQLQVTPGVLARVRDVTSSIMQHSDLVARTYANDIAQLDAYFDQLAQQGAAGYAESIRASS